MQEVIRKCRFKNGGVVLNAPTEIAAAFKAHNFKTGFETDVKSENTLIFIKDREALLNSLRDDLAKITPDSLLWLAFPKGTSKVVTDINRDSIRTTAESYGLGTVSAISIDDTWSALRLRPLEKIGR